MIDLRLGPSRALAWSLGGLYGLAAIGCGTVVQPRWAGAALALALVALGVDAVRRHALRRGRGAVVRVREQADGTWCVEHRGGRRSSGWRLDPGASLAHPALTVLALRAGRRRARLAVAADAADPQTRRALRVRLLG